MLIEKINERTFENLLLEKLSHVKSSGIRSKDFGIFKSKILVRSSIQKLIFDNHKDAFYNNVFKPIILDASIKSEKASGGSGEICLNLILELLEESLRIKNNHGHTYLKQIIEDKMDDIESLILSNSRKLEKKDIVNILKSRLEEKNRKILNEAILLSGSTYTIFVEKSGKRETSISLQHGSSFSSPDTVNDYTFGKEWSYSNTRCLVIDGIIESVSEIHHLLEEAAKTSLPYVIFCRGVSKDVSHTIQVNLKRGTINLVPICVGFDENTLNILNDIATVINCEVVSSTKGDLISSAAKDRVVTVDLISIDEKNISIQNAGSEDKIKNQIRYLRKRKLNSEKIEMVDLFDKRIKSLIQGKVKVSIGTEILSKNPSAVEEIDAFLRNLKSLVSFGVIDLSKIKKSLKISNNFDKILFEYLRSLPNIDSSLGLLVAVKYSFSCLNMINSVGNCLIEERKNNNVNKK